MPNRRGRGHTLTADEIETILAAPVFYIFTKQAQPAFPGSTVSNPAAFVQIIQVGNDIRSDEAIRFPVFVGWRQWRDVVVPVLEDDKWTLYFGRMGRAPITTQQGHGLFYDKIDELITLIGKELRRRAIEAGYGPP
jgi:hypothetical protein